MLRLDTQGDLSPLTWSKAAILKHRMGLTKQDCGAASGKFGIIARHGLSRLRVKRTLHLLFALEMDFDDQVVWQIADHDTIHTVDDQLENTRQRF